MGRKRKEILPRRRVDWGVAFDWIGLAARHGRVLLQPPGFAVPAPILWRTAVPRRAPPRPPGIWQAAGISRRFALISLVNTVRDGSVLLRQVVVLI